MKTTLFFLIFLTSLCADNDKQQNDDHKNHTEEEYEENDDIWYGPGFYYGIWFSNESDYWGWRNGHRYYPPNHEYYNRDRPIPYHSEGHEEHQEHGGHSGRH